MANYDSAATYDSGIFYDDFSVPQLPRRMAKIKVKLALSSKSDADLLTFAQAHVTAMTSNANFATPLPSAANFTAALTPYSTALGAFNTAQAAAKLATTNKDTARLALENVLTARGNYVELTASTAADPTAVIESAAFGVKSGKTPSGVPNMVQNLALTAGDNAGELDAQWDPVSGTKINYDIQWTLTPATEASWKDLPGSTKSKSVLTGFTSGQQIYIRVRAKGSGGTGAWSQNASKFAP